MITNRRFNVNKQRSIQKGLNINEVLASKNQIRLAAATPLV
jgi:hypothetical protein